MNGENILLKMRITTAGGPADVVCTSEDRMVYCQIKDVTTGRELANFIIREDLVAAIPEIIKLYVG